MGLRPDEICRATDLWCCVCGEARFLNWRISVELPPEGVCRGGAGR